MITNTLYGIAFAQQRATIEAYKLDGQQQLYLGACMASQLTILDMQWANAGYQLSPLLGTVANIMFVAMLILPLVNRGVEYLGKTWEMRAISTACQTILSNVDILINTIFTYTGSITDGMCLVSYVAMIAFGHPLIGGFGLAGFVFSLIKIHGYLPACIDDLLTPLQLATLLMISVTSPHHIVFRSVQFIFSLGLTMNHVCRQASLQPYLPNFLIGGDKKQILLPTDRPGIDFKKKLNYLEQFCINQDSFWAEPLRHVLPQSDDEQLAAVDIEALYTRIEERASRQNVLINKDGWARMKSGVVDSRICDVKPINFEFGKKLLTSLLSNMETMDDDAFKNRIEELANLGSSCAEGWLREISFMLNPHAQGDYAWMVHHHLAVLRGNIMKAIIGKMMEKVNQHGDFVKVGGGNNIHLTNQVQSALWHRWRTYEGEVVMHLQGRSLFTRLLQNNDDSNAPYVGGGVSHTISNTLLALGYITLPLMAPVQLIADAIDQEMQQHYTIDALIQAIKEAIKPEYGEVLENNQRVMQSLRAIEWEAIATWLTAVSERGICVLDPVTDAYDQDLVGQDTQKQSFLTEKGVMLLLWDLGIIKNI